MKKDLFIIAMLFAVLGCSKSDLIEVNANGNSIKFDTYVSKNTKVASTIDNTFNSFYVWGIKAGASDEWDYTSISLIESASEEMNAQLVKRADASSSWNFKDNDGNNIDFYWPDLGNKCHFFASTLKFTVPENPTDFNIQDLSYGGIGFCFQQPTAVSDQKDILVAKSNEITIVSSNPDVSLDFKHALSRVLFKVKCDVNYSVFINEIGIDGLYDGGEYDYLSETWTSYMYDEHATAAEYYCVNVNDAVRTTGITGNAEYSEVQLPEGELTLLPQTRSAWTTSSPYNSQNATRIKISYKIINSDGVVISPMVGEWQEAYLPIAVNFEMNKRYSINIDMKHGGGFTAAGDAIVGRSTIRLTTSFTDWEVGTPIDASY